MNSIKIAIFGILLLALGIVIGLQMAGLPLFSMPGEPASATDNDAGQTGSIETDERESGAGTGKPTVDSMPVEPLNRAYIRRMLANLDDVQRQQLLIETDKFHAFVEQEAHKRSIEAAARANNMQRNDNVAFMMRHAANQMLREMYINQLMQEQLPADFPTDEQVRQFYENNRDRFKTPERVQVWQVFIENTEEGSVAAEEQARDVLEQLRRGDLTMAAAAIEHSAHLPSQRNDGYMGAVQSEELKPAIAEFLQAMGQGEYGLARSDDGLHILKKGRTLAAAPQPFETVREQARQWLIARIQQQFRQAVLDQASQEYSFMPSDNRIEQWRLELKTGAND